MVRSSWVVFLFAIACSSKSTTNTIEKDAGSGGGGGSGGVAGSGGDPCVVSNPGWPDSATEYCTDGSAQPAACSALPGQDASYKENTPGYLECSGAIRDTVTGLSWSPVFSGLSQADGMTKCQGLPPGEGPWRLPSLLELVSILDLGSKAPAASNLFGIAAQSQLYSSTAAANGGAWVVSFEFGFVKPSVNAASPLDVICVRGAPLVSALTATGTVVDDSGTGLSWQATPAANTFDWPSAIATCEGATTGNHDDWRLPNIKELITLVKTDATSGAMIDTAKFSGIGGADAFWSSTPYRDAAFSSAWALHLAVGNSVRDGVELERRALCVRTL